MDLRLNNFILFKRTENRFQSRDKRKKRDSYGTGFRLIQTGVIKRRVFGYTTTTTTTTTVGVVEGVLTVVVGRSPIHSVVPLVEVSTEDGIRMFSGEKR